jgi:hypothetical protein
VHVPIYGIQLSDRGSAHVIRSRIIFDREWLWIDVEGTSGVAEVKRHLVQRQGRPGA